jgi:hypothetical protein
MIDSKDINDQSRGNLMLNPSTVVPSVYAIDSFYVHQVEELNGVKK